MGMYYFFFQITMADESTLRVNLESQLAELEILESMFEPSELKVEDRNSISEIQAYLDDKLPIKPQCIDLIIKYTSATKAKFELCVTFTHDYPQNEPEIFVRSEKSNRSQHTQLNKDLIEYISTIKGEPCVYSAFLWIQENSEQYISQEEAVPAQKKIVDRNEKITRLWIYSHHIYSKTKRKEILSLANSLKLNGFCMPGKPGVICVEGPLDDCNDWWSSIKSMSWKKIVCKVTEDVAKVRFSSFEELSFQSHGDRCSHMDLGELHSYLDELGLAHIFRQLFGVGIEENC